MGLINKWTLVSVLLAVFLVCLRIRYDDTFLETHSPSACMKPRKDADRFLTTDAGLWLYTQHWGPPDDVEKQSGIVFILHGYGEHSGRVGYQWLGEELSSRGWEVVTMDFQGHGKSSGTRGHAVDFKDYVEDAWFLIETYMEERDEPAFVFAHSMGTLVATLVAMEHPDDVAGIVYTGMPIEVDPSIVTPFMRTVCRFLSTWMPKFIIDELPTDNLPPSHAEDKLVFTHIRARFSFGFLNACDRISEAIEDVTYPFRMYHGANDSIAAASGAEEFFARAGSDDKDITVISDGQHELLEGDYREQILNETDAFFRSLAKKAKKEEEGEGDEEPERNSELLGA